MNVIPFEFDGSPVRVITDDEGTPWFVAADLCKSLGLSDNKGSYRHHLEKLDDDERASIPRSLVQGTPTLNMGVVAAAICEAAGGAVWAEPEMWMVSESGAYTLILRTREATTPGTAPYRFRKWVTSEVLPAIRKTGQYLAPNVEPTSVSITSAQFSQLLDNNTKMGENLTKLVEVVTQLAQVQPARVSTSKQKSLIEKSLEYEADPVEPKLTKAEHRKVVLVKAILLGPLNEMKFSQDTGIPLHTIRQDIKEARARGVDIATYETQAGLVYSYIGNLLRAATAADYAQQT